MKKYLITALLLLTSCSSSTPTGLVENANDDFTIQIPSTWVVFQKWSNAIPKPKVWEVALAVSSPDVVDGFSNNLLILKENLDNATTSDKYSMLNNFWVEQDYKEYEKISEKDINFTDNNELGKLYTFKAKYNVNTPKLTFLQTARVCHEKKGFFLTIALPMNITDTAKYEDILKTFACKKEK